MSGIVDPCPLFIDLSEDKHKNTVKPKLVTVRCQGLDLFFNGINYVSLDVVNNNIVPNGLDYSEVNIYEEVARLCPLCGSKGALKYLKVKVVEHKPFRGKAAPHLQNEGAERGTEDIKESDGEEVLIGMSVKRHELADRLGSLSTDKGKVENEPSHASEKMRRKKERVVDKWVRGGLAESTSASRYRPRDKRLVNSIPSEDLTASSTNMGWD